MGSRGPSRTPKDILKMRGSWLAEARGDEPQAEKVTALRCPGWLSDEGKRACKQVIKQMGIMGILTLADVNIVARYSSATGDLVSEYCRCLRVGLFDADESP